MYGLQHETKREVYILDFNSEGPESYLSRNRIRLISQFFLTTDWTIFEPLNRDAVCSPKMGRPLGFLITPLRHAHVVVSPPFVTIYE